MIKSKLCVLLVVMLSATGLCLAEVPAPEVVVYKQTPETDLAITILRPDPKLTKRNKKGTPAILYFFGGGFRSGNIDRLRPQAEVMRDQGMVAILVDYRVNNTHNVLPNKGIEDARSAIRYVRANAKQLGINPDMIVCSGASSGGHISASLTFIDVFNDENDDLSISAVPNAVVLMCPGVDCSPEVQGYESLFRQLDRDWHEFSPIHNIKAGSPPVLFLVGDQDKLVSLDTAYAFESKMKAVNADFELIVYEGGEHSFCQLNGKSGKNYFYEVMDDAIKFLKDRGFISRR